VIHGGKRSAWEANGKVQFSEHRESLGTGDFMDQVRSDQELGLATREVPDPVGLPHLAKEILASLAHVGIRLVSIFVLWFV
jgi:hypothetical protein